MNLVAFCTVSVAIILFFASSNQFVYDGIPEGFDSDWKFVISRKAFSFFALVLILTSAVRHGYVDTFAYKELYINARNNLAYVNNAPWGVEKGWMYFCYFLNFISPSPNFMLLISAMIIIGVYVYSIKRYSCDPVFSLIIFYCLEYMDTNNGVRQMVASALCIVAFLLITEKNIKNYICFVLLVLLAMQFHESAFVCFIILIAVVGKPINIRTAGAFGLGFLFWMAPGLVNAQLGDMFGDSKYAEYLTLTVGMSFMRAFIVGILPALLAFIYIKKVKGFGEKIEYSEGILLNILLINSMFTIMGLNMQYWARMAFYTSFASFILMPKLAYEVLPRNRSAIKAIAVVCYFIFFAYNVYVNIGYGAIGDFYFDVSWTGGLQ